MAILAKAKRPLHILVSHLRAQQKKISAAALMEQGIGQIPTYKEGSHECI